jgi:hypothetical protein
MVRYCFLFVSAQMKTLSILLLSLLIGLFSSGPALATVLAEGKPKGGYYWQKVSGSNGTKMLCRAQSEAKIQKAAQCTNAGAVKPE